jgi:hypothetical protein
MRYLNKLTLRKAGRALSLGLLLVVFVPHLVAADPLSTIIKNRPFYDADANKCSSDSSPLSEPGGEIGSSTDITWTGIYESNTSPPYNVEMWATHLLKSLALRKNVSEATVVTKEHILAIVAFATIEGGGVDGHAGNFNLLNTKRHDPDLHATPRGSEGGSRANAGLSGGGGGGPATYDFPTFDAGIEANTRAMIASKYQSRLVTSLIDGSSTAIQFFQTLTYYDRYPGNLAWAAASDPRQGGDPVRYLNTLLDTLNKVNGSYQQYAGKPLNGSAPGAAVTGSGGSSSGGSTDDCTASNDGAGEFANLENVVYFSQCDPKWANHPYPYPGDPNNENDRFVCSSGCGPM